MTDFHERFDVEAALIGELFVQSMHDGEQIRSLEQQLNDAYRFIAYLIDRFGEDHFNSRMVRVSRWDLVDAPMNPKILRWEDVVNGDLCLGVRKNEH